MKKLLMLSILVLMSGISFLNAEIFVRRPLTEEAVEENPELAERAFDLEEGLGQTDTY